MQFSFTNPDAVPSSVKRLPQETPAERAERKGLTNTVRAGESLIQPTEGCSISRFTAELEAAGYELVDASYKPRLDAKDPSGRRTYHMVRFVFARHEFAEPSDEFKKVRESVRVDLQKACDLAYWRTRSFSNPFYQNGEEVPEARAMSINFEARQPRYLPDGNLVTEWQKDENGKRVGEVPLPIKAKHHLHIVDGEVLPVAV